MWPATVSKIESLTPVGVDPHSFEPTPADVRKVADSTLLIVNGAGFESFLAELLENAGGQRQVVEAAAGLTSRTAREGEEAVMTEEEKAEALCAGLPEMAAEEVTAGADAASASELHAHEAAAAATSTKPRWSRLSWSRPPMAASAASSSWMRQRRATTSWRQPPGKSS